MDEIQVLMARHLVASGASGASWQAWLWILNGTLTSPITLAARLGRPPTETEIVAELAASTTSSYSCENETDLCRQILEWITGRSDEIPDLD